MTAPELFRVGEDRLLCDDWHSRHHTVVLRPGDPMRSLHVTSIRRVVAELGERGAARVLTPAMDERRLEPFAAAGFRPHEQLCVLRHDLDGLAAPRGPRCRRGFPITDAARAAHIDTEAFDETVQLDATGVRAILAATPTSRFRVIRHGTPRRHAGAAYAICGHVGDQGFLQRLAVDTAHRRQGLGTALVLDGLWWFRRMGARRAWVNTQQDNAPARCLYRVLGFVDTPGRLAVWSWTPGST